MTATTTTTAVVVEDGYTRTTTIITSCCPSRGEFVVTNVYSEPTNDPTLRPAKARPWYQQKPRVGFKKRKRGHD